MAYILKKNEYGKFYYQQFNKSKAKRVIFYIHDLTDMSEFHKKFADELKVFHYYSACLPCDSEMELESGKKLTFDYLVKYIKDLIISLDIEKLFLIGHGIGGAIATEIANIVPTRIVKLVLINPVTSNIGINDTNNLINLPRNVPETYSYLQKMYDKEDTIFNRGIDSNEVINRARRIVYNYREFINFSTNLVSTDNIKRMKRNEENLSVPTLLITGEKNKVLGTSAMIKSFKRKATVAEFKNSYYYPMHDEFDKYVETVMSFFIFGEKLYNVNRLPNNYIFKFLQNDIKQNYMNTHGEKLQERLQRIEQLKVKQENPYDEEPINVEESLYYANQSFEMIKDSIKLAEQKVSEVLASNIDKNIIDDIDTYEINSNEKPNSIYNDSKGHKLFNDANGNAYGMNELGNWIILKK